MFKTNCSPLGQRYKKMVLVFKNKSRGGRFTLPIFDNKLLSSSQPLKFGPKYCVLPIKQIKQIKCRPMRQLQTETGGSLAKF